MVWVAGCRDRSLELIGFRVSASAPVAATGEDRTLVPDRLAKSLGHLLVVYVIAERLDSATAARARLGAVNGFLDSVDLRHRQETCITATRSGRPSRRCARARLR